MTFTAFLAALSDLAVDGVKTVKAYPPAALNDAELPALWPQLPRSGEEADMTLAGHGGKVDAMVDLVIALKSVNQGIQSGNFADAVTMMDNLRDGLRALNMSGTRLRWTIKQTGVQVAGMDYWAVIATITGKV